MDERSLEAYSGHSVVRAPDANQYGTGPADAATQASVLTKPLMPDG